MVAAGKAQRKLCDISAASGTLPQYDPIIADSQLKSGAILNGRVIDQEYIALKGILFFLGQELFDVDGLTGYQSAGILAIGNFFLPGGGQPCLHVAGADGTVLKHGVL